ncbi:MAG TPA: tetratricopeptide repeat protein [Ktedonobacterales bacterium]|jgi:tetratricopeptide (TPR) repeat protein
MPDTTPDAPTQMQIFVSHNHLDATFCHALIKELHDAGADVWYDEHNMGAGRLTTEVERELRARPVFIVILSPAALGSHWVEDEARWAYTLYRKDPKRIILPVLVEAVNDNDIWLFLSDFRRVETPGNQPYPQEEAIRRTLRVLALTPAGEQPVMITPQPGESLEGLLIQGNALLAQKQYAEALPFFERAALRGPNSFIAWLNLAYALDEFKRYEEALVALDRALEIDPNSVIAWNNKGIVLRALERYDDALEAYDRALAFDPNDATAWLNKGHALHLMKRYQESLEALERAQTLDPNEELIWANKGAALVGLGRYAEALEALEKAKQMGDTLDEEDLTNKAVALRALGREAEAQEAERRAKELGG